MRSRFAERNREIVELPEGLETNRTITRKRGARADDDVIQEAMEIFAARHHVDCIASLRWIAVRDVAQVAEARSLPIKRTIFVCAQLHGGRMVCETSHDLRATRRGSALRVFGSRQVARSAQGGGAESRQGRGHLQPRNYCNWPRVTLLGDGASHLLCRARRLFPFIERIWDARWR